MKKVLILQMRPEDETADSEFQAILRVGGLKEEQVERLRVEKLAVRDIDLPKYCAIIAGGSPFDVSTPADEKSLIQKEVEAFFKRLFNQIVPLDFPFLGACSGNGLLGSYLGAVISTKYPEPVGHTQVSKTEAAANDDLLTGLPQQFTAFVGHKEACDDVPPGAVLLVTSAACPVQMFRVKNNIYATQFHPEADENEFTLRINIYKEYGYFPPEDAQKLINAVKGVEAPEAKEILSRFVQKYTR